MIKNRWILFTILYISALSVALSQLKVVMIFPNIINATGIQPDQVSWLMSVFVIAGIVLAIPGSAILDKLGSKNLLLCLLTTVIAGNLLGAIANSYSILLLSRIIEGIAFAMITMVGIVFISQWFAKNNIGFAIGLYTTFPALGSVLCMNFTTPIATGLGVKSVWFIVAIIAAISFAFVLFGIKTPKAVACAGSPPAKERGSIGKVILNKDVWLLALCQGCVAFILFAFITLYPQLFIEKYHLNQAIAGFYAGLNGLFGIISCTLAGIIIDKSKNTPLLVFIAFIGLAISCFITTMLNTATYVLHTLLTAIFFGFIMPAVLYIAKSVTKQAALIGYTVAFVNMIYCLGIFVGVPVVMSTVTNIGWQGTTSIMVAVSLMGALAMFVFMFINKKNK